MVQETSQSTSPCLPPQPTHGEEKDNQAVAPSRPNIFGELRSVSGFFTHGFRHPLETARTMAPTAHQLTFGLVGKAFKPERDIGDLAGKVILVTGGM